jgi:hypothetical protein
MTPPSAEGGGRRTPDQAPVAADSSNTHADSTAAVSQPAERIVRCASGRPCVEVAARVRAGQEALHVTGCVEQGRQLLATAQRIAELHGHGTPAEGASEGAA